MSHFACDRFLVLLAAILTITSCSRPGLDARAGVPDVDAIFYRSSAFSVGDEYQHAELATFHNEDKLFPLDEGRYLRTWMAGFEGVDGQEWLLFYQIVNIAGEAISEQRVIPNFHLEDFEFLPLSADRWLASAVSPDFEAPNRHFIVTTYLLSGEGEMLQQQQVNLQGNHHSGVNLQIIRADDPACASVLVGPQVLPVCFDSANQLTIAGPVTLPTASETVEHAWHHHGKNYIYSAEQQKKVFQVQTYNTDWQAEPGSIELGQDIVGYGNSPQIEERGHQVLISWGLNEDVAEDYEWVLFGGGQSNRLPTRGRLRCHSCQHGLWPSEHGLIPVSENRFLLAWQDLPAAFRSEREGFNLVLLDPLNQWNSQPLFLPFDFSNSGSGDWDVLEQHQRLLLTWNSSREEPTTGYPDKKVFKRMHAAVIDLIFPDSAVPAHRQILRAEHWQQPPADPYIKAVDAFLADEFAKAREQFRQLAEQGYSHSRYVYSRMLIHGLGGDKELEAGSDLFRQLIAAEYPGAIAAAHSDVLLTDALAITRDDGFSGYAAALGSADAQYAEARQYAVSATIDGKYPSPEDASSIIALKMLQNAATVGDARAQYLLAAWLQQGIATAKDEAGAEVWLQRSAEQGYPPAKADLQLSGSHRFGIAALAPFMLPETEKKATLLELAEAGRPAAMVRLASLLWFKEEQAEAVSWLEKAFRAGFIEGASWLASIYSESSLAVFSPGRAHVWLRTYVEATREYRSDQAVMEQQETWQWAIERDQGGEVQP